MSLPRRVPVVLAETDIPIYWWIIESKLRTAVISAPSIISKVILGVLSGSVHQPHPEPALRRGQDRLLVAHWLGRPGPGPPPLCMSK